MVLAAFLVACSTPSPDPRKARIEELERVQFVYVKASDARRAALAPRILTMADEVGEKDLPTDLRWFIGHVRNAHKKGK